MDGWISYDLERSGRDLIVSCYAGIRLDEQRKTKLLNEDSPSPGRDFNPGHCEYEEEVLTPYHDVWCHCVSRKYAQLINI